MTDQKSVTCSDCKFCVFQDYGYSNYTVEGTTFICALNKHPDGQFDRFYGENPQLSFAANCYGFEAGECINLDCDGEDYDDLNPEQKSIVDKARAL